MASIRDILKSKSNPVISIHPEALLLDAVKLLCEHRIGSLLVLDPAKRPIGIITERDILREVHEHYEQLTTRRVEQVMTKDLICGLIDDDIDYVMGVMTNNRIRHLPIIEGHALVGMISIGDLIKLQLHHSQVENRYLRDYISRSV